MSHIIKAEDHLSHIGTLDQSGRYVRGSGKQPYQSIYDWVSLNARMTKEFPKETERAKAMGFKSTDEYRKYRSVANGMKRNADVDKATRLRERGWSTHAIAENIGVSETQVRNLLKPRDNMRQSVREQATAALKAQVDEVGFLDVGKGTESSMQITEDMKKKALYALQLEGYEVYNIKENQMIGERTNTLVLAKPGTSFQETRDNIENIKPFVGAIDDFDRSRNPLGFEPPIAVDPKRLDVKWGEDGGGTADGVIYVRPGVKDLSLGENHYAQVRIQVGDEHFLKGMAIYKDDLPAGVDLQFNTPDPKSANKLDALKPLKRNEQTGEIDLENPFGSMVRQFKDENGNVTSAANIVNEVDDWDGWSKNLSSQFLSKQSLPLARTQLELTRSNKTAELEEILSLENPVVKKHMLMQFADSADAAAEHLKAAQMPNQKTHVILPVNSLKPNEVFAPNYENGDRVVLIRYPHGGTFEIPELVVNNKNKEGERLLGRNNEVAVGIHHKVAEQLSGADFDGDTVVVIPNNQGKITARRPLKELENFDTKVNYGWKGEGDPPYPVMKKTSTSMEMGKASNLLTDMQIKGASDEEIARATKHSMVVIDAAKHKLDYQRSYRENGIAALKKAYQEREEDGRTRTGASTLISRASAPTDIPERRLRKASEGGSIDIETGELVYVQTGKTKRKKLADGTWVDSDVPKTSKVSAMETVKDAHKLSSGTAMEGLYADHANAMKSMANKARREWVRTPNGKADPQAKVKYAKEVEELDSALRLAKANAPRERHAQRVAQAMVRARMDDNPGMDKSEIKKIKGATLKTARDLTGAGKARIEPTDKQWEAIQAGAISPTKLSEIMSNGNMDRIVELATPKKKTTVSSTQAARIKAMANSGYTQAEIAAHLGISTGTVNQYT